MLINRAGAVSVALVGGASRSSASTFEVGYVGDDGRELRRPLTMLAEHAFECVVPVRSFPSFRGQRNNTGWWWTATTAAHVGFESWLERDHVISLDFDPAVVGLTSQPFWLSWHDGERVRSHAPDYFARLVDGTGMVVDCRPAERIKPRDAAAFAATKRACAEVGWRFALVGAPEPVRMANLRWLAGYRHPRCRRHELARAAVELAVEPHGVLELASALGDPLGTLPVVFHLLWCGELETNLSVPLTENALVRSSKPAHSAVSVVSQREQD